MKMKKLIFSVFALSAMMLSACSGGGEEQPSSSEAGGSTTQQTSSQGTSQTSSGEATSSGESSSSGETSSSGESSSSSEDPVTLADYRVQIGDAIYDLVEDTAQDDHDKQYTLGTTGKAVTAGQAISFKKLGDNDAYSAFDVKPSGHDIDHFKYNNVIRDGNAYKVRATAQSAQLYLKLDGETWSYWLNEGGQISSRYLAVSHSGQWDDTDYVGLSQNPMNPMGYTAKKVTLQEGDLFYFLAVPAEGDDEAIYKHYSNLNDSGEAAKFEDAGGSDHNFKVKTAGTYNFYVTANMSGDVVIKSYIADDLFLRVVDDSNPDPTYHIDETVGLDATLEGGKATYSIATMFSPTYELSIFFKEGTLLVPTITEGEDFIEEVSGKSKVFHFVSSGLYSCKFTYDNDALSIAITVPPKVATVYRLGYGANEADTWQYANAIQGTDMVPEEYYYHSQARYLYTADGTNGFKLMDNSGHYYGSKYLYDNPTQTDNNIVLPAGDYFVYFADTYYEYYFISYERVPVYVKVGASSPVKVNQITEDEKNVYKYTVESLSTEESVTFFDKDGTTKLELVNDASVTTLFNVNEGVYTLKANDDCDYYFTITQGATELTLSVVRGAPARSVWLGRAGNWSKVAPLTNHPDEGHEDELVALGLELQAGDEFVIRTDGDNFIKTVFDGGAKDNFETVGGNIQVKAGKSGTYNLYIHDNLSKLNIEEVVVEHHLDVTFNITIGDGTSGDVDYVHIKYRSANSGNIDQELDVSGSGTAWTAHTNNITLINDDDDLVFFVEVHTSALPAYQNAQVISTTTPEWTALTVTVTNVDDPVVVNITTPAITTNTDYSAATKTGTNCTVE